MSYKIFNFKKFKNISGELLPITFDKKFPIKVKRIFFIYGKKNIIEVIMHTKSVHRFFFHYLVKLKLLFSQKKSKKTLH